MKQYLHLHYLRTCLAILLLTGCASLGLAPAQTFEQKLAYSYGVHTAVLNTAAAGVTAGSLSKADGQEVLTLADQSRALLDAAKVASKAGDVSTASGKLLLATAILTQLQSYLQARSK